MKRALAILGAFVLLTGGGVGLLRPSSVGAQATAAPTRTDIRYFLPYDGDQIHAGLTVSGETTGDCDEESLVIQDRPDAYFCQEANGGILDPCFANPMGTVDGPTDLVCADSPISRQVIRLKTTKALSSSETGAAMTGSSLDALAVPWFLELANGKQCGLMRGASAGMAGMRINLSCVGGGYVFGELDQSGSVWFANYTDESTPDSSQVAVVAVWT